MNRTDEVGHSLRKRGFRVTPQRELILAAMRAGDGHCTAEEVYAHVAVLAPSLSRATVYRTLEFLVREHLVTSADLGEGRRVFELVTAEVHHHLVCTRCKSVQQIGHALIAEMFATVEREHGFAISTDHLALFGLCGRCRSAESLS